ncbi:MAG: hypothetical protein WD451_01785 [Thermoanaerobaculia bacterium]
MRTTFEAEGEVRGTDLLAALVALWREGANGTLQFSRSGATAGFELGAGEIVGTSSSDPRFETAAILLRAGKLDEATLERLKASEDSDRAQSALQAGVLTRREWRWGEKIRAVEILSDLLTWLDGEYWLFRTGGSEAGEFRLSIPRLVLELFLRSRDRGLVLHHLGGVDVPLVRAGHFDAEFATFGLTPDAESVVRLIDGRSTVAEISSEAPAEAFAVEKLLAALVTLGLVHPEFAASEPAPRPPARPAPDEEDEERETREEEPEENESEDAQDPVRAGEPQTQERTSSGDGGEEVAEELRAGSEASEARLESEAEEIPAPAELGSEGLDLAELERGAVSASAFESPAAGDFDPTEVGMDADRAMPGDLMETNSRDSNGGSVLDRPLDMTTGVGNAERPRQGAGASWLWLLVALAAAVGALLYWRSRGPAAPEPASPPVATATPTAAPDLTPVPLAAMAPTAPPGPVPTRPPAASSTRPPRAAALTARPTATAAATAPSKTEPAPQSRAKWLERAARDRRKADADRRARFTIQLELACELESLTDAWKHDRPAGTMWVLTTPFHGRTCFRVQWGRYLTREAARRALSGAPAFFSTPRNRPIVVPVR